MKKIIESFMCKTFYCIHVNKKEPHTPKQQQQMKKRNFCESKQTETNVMTGKKRACKKRLATGAIFSHVMSALVI